MDESHQPSDVEQDRPNSPKAGGITPLVGGALAIIGGVGAVSNFDQLDMLRSPSADRLGNAVGWFVAAQALYAIHFTLMAVGGWLIVRESKRAVRFLNGSVVAWGLGVMAEVWMARLFWQSEGREQVNPTLIILLNAFSNRATKVIPSVAGLVFVRLRKDSTSLSTRGG